MPPQRRPWLLPSVLLGATRAHLAQAHRLLAEQGHPNTRPVHGFALQAIGRGSTTVEVAAALGVSKQAAGKTVQMLEEEGYVARSTDPEDARRKLIVPTDRGQDFLERSVDAFAQVRAAWADEIGARRLAQLEDDLGALCADQALRLDTAGWISADS